MSRPPRSRIVDMPMRTVYFKPSGKLPASAERVSLKFEELEALRLADLEGLSQSEASSGMGVSRHTFGRGPRLCEEEGGPESRQQHSARRHGRHELVPSRIRRAAQGASRHEDRHFRRRPHA